MFKIKFQLLFFIVLAIQVIQVKAINYDIANCIELQNISLDLAGNYTLTDDIDCSDTINWNANTGFIPIGTLADPFTGDLNGNGHTISDLTISRQALATDNQAIFAYASNASFNQLSIAGASIDGRDNVAVLVARANNLIISELTLNSIILSANHFSGAIAARLEDSNVSDIHATGVLVDATEYSASLFGESINSIFMNIIANNLTLNNLRLKSAGIWGSVTDSDITNVEVHDINITAAGILQELAGLIGEALGACHIKDIDLNNIVIDATGAGGFGTRVVAGMVADATGSPAISTYENCTINDLTIDAIYSAAGMFGKTNAQIKNCSVEHLDINPTDPASFFKTVAGFASIVSPGAKIENCHVKNGEIISSQGFAGFVGTISGFSAAGVLVKNCYVDGLNAEAFGFSAGFSYTANALNMASLVFENCQVRNCIFENITSGFVADGDGNSNAANAGEQNLIFRNCSVINTDFTGASVSLFGAFASMLYDVQVLTSYVEDISANLTNSMSGAGFIHDLGTASLVNNCYVANSNYQISRPANNTEFACFTHESIDRTFLVNLGPQISNAYCDATITADNLDEFIFDKDPLTSLSNTYYNDDNNVAANNYGATALNAAQFLDLKNFIGFDPLVWYQGLTYPILKENISDQFNRLLVKFTKVYPYSPANKIISHLKLFSNADDHNFSYRLTAGQDDFYLSDNKIYSRRVFNRNERLPYTIEAINSSNQYLRTAGFIKVENVAFSIEDEQSELIVEEENSCEVLLKEALSLKDDEELSKKKLIEFYYQSLASANDVLDTDLLSCRQITDLKEDLALLKLKNKKNIIKKYQNFTISFIRNLKRQARINLFDHTLDTNHDTLLNITDFRYLRTYFLAVAELKYSNNPAKLLKAEKQLKRIERKSKLKRFMSISQLDL
jgi:hypothetical protein